MRIKARGMAKKTSSCFFPHLVSQEGPNLEETEIG